ncbi:hypothetical protein Nepgr_007131 [Nepenthes gracilis]|uniref:Protein kinase domain-containing protein n=1 Tax=Nepenthes gracilis TaxID=150966 RepID=A0AAD3S6K8_NEPGR|nr:hypothetical protein Nepgr_007131 [Nepenthes gracilis]
MNWTRGKVIGHGSSAIVSLAKGFTPEELSVVKTAELTKSTLLQNESRIHSSIRCPYIIQYRGHDVTFEDGRLMYNIFMEYASGGTLGDAIYRQGGRRRRLAEAKIKSYTKAILRGLEHLHSNHVVHCDIKGANILLMKDGEAKIADLGCAKRVTDCPSADSSHPVLICGTPLYLAPEAARGEQQSYPADVWALGCTVIEMATGQPPWPGLHDQVSALFYIGFSGEVPQIPCFLSEPAKDFLGKCLKRVPEERWSATELLNHPFVNGAEDVVTGEEHKPKLDTPTTVLDQGLWESRDGPDSAPKDLVQSSHPDSPSRRIQRLLGGFPISTAAAIPNWDIDENWMNVRSVL